MIKKKDLLGRAIVFAIGMVILFWLISKYGVEWVSNWISIIIFIGIWVIFVLTGKDKFLD